MLFRQRYLSFSWSNSVYLFCRETSNRILPLLKQSNLAPEAVVYNYEKSCWIRIPVLCGSSLTMSQLSSTPLQVLLYLNSWYFAAFFAAECLMFIYKGRFNLNMNLWYVYRWSLRPLECSKVCISSQQVFCFHTHHQISSWTLCCCFSFLALKSSDSSMVGNLFAGNA